MESVRDRVAAIVEEMGISQAEIGRRIGVGRQWVNRRLTGRIEISADDVPRLAEALRVSVVDIYGVHYAEGYRMAGPSPTVEFLAGAVLSKLDSMGDTECRFLASLIDLLASYRERSTKLEVNDEHGDRAAGS